MNDYIYTTQRYEAEVPVDAYLKECVDVPTFLEYCKQCPNYGKVWSCPPYDFSPEEYWKKYRMLHLISVKINFPEEMTEKKYTQDEISKLIEEVLWGERRKLMNELLDMEKQFPGSVVLSAGTCMYCRGKGCARAEGKPCRAPEKIRYSIESLGGNVGLTVSKYLNQEIQWISDGKLPEHLMLLCGLLLRHSED